MATTDANKLRSLAAAVGVGSLALFGVTACDTEEGAPAEEDGAVDEPAQEPAEDPAQEDPAEEDPAQDPAQDPAGEDPMQEDPAQEDPAEDPAQEDPAGEDAEEDSGL